MSTRTLGVLATLLLAAACAGEGGEGVDPGTPPEQLPLPDISGLDLEASFGEALEVLTSADLRAPWEGHTESLDSVRNGCPDFWAGSPEGDDGPDVPYGWQDHCTTQGDFSYTGFLAWDNSISMDGDPESLLGTTINGSRLMEGAASVHDGDELLFSFVGTGNDAMYRSESVDYLQWSYTTNIAGTSRGSASHPASATIPGGFRAELFLNYTGGEVSSMEARGELYLQERRLQQRFDSISVDIALAGPGALGPDDCSEEPLGWISLRDENAYWYDLIFQPRYEDDATDEDFENLPYGECDGCGTLYIRGVQVDTVCMDFSWFWDGSLGTPDPEDYVLPLREGMQVVQ